MSIIPGIIGMQAFEYVLDRIGRILVDELNNQVVLSGNYYLEMKKIYKERLIPYAPADCPALNVMLERGDLHSQHQGQSKGVYRYIIEGTYGADFTDDERGDTLAMLRLQSLLGKCRAILEDPRYKTLGFVPPFVMNRHVENIYFMKVIRQDADAMVAGRITLVVSVPENSDLILPNLIKGYDTQVKLYDTDQGYLWSLDQPQDVRIFDESFDYTYE